VFVSISRDAFANDVHAIVDCLSDRQHFEITGGQIAKKVQVVHLTLNPNERVLGSIANIRRSDDHSSQVDPPNLAAA